MPTANEDWVARTAAEVIAEGERRHPGEAPTCASGISPSGSVHLGNLRELMTPYLVADEVRRSGHPCRHILSWDDYDRFRRVPAGFPESFTTYVGQPLTSVPDPAGDCHVNWAEHFKEPLRESLAKLGIRITEISQTQMYTSGAYTKQIIKVDWPMRWAYERVTFEPAGVDHSSPGSSFTVGRHLVEDIFGGEVPLHFGYSFVGTQGSAKMSGSAGGAPTPKDALKIFETPLVRWLYARRRPEQSITLAFDTEVGRVYDEWDALTRKVNEGTAEPEVRPRLDCARAWVLGYAPDEARTTVRGEPDHRMLASLSEQDRRALKLLLDRMAEHWSLERLTTLLYGIPKLIRGLSIDAPPTSDLKVAQRAWFVLLYRLLIGKDTGPRLPTLLLALGQERVRTLLDA